MELSRHPDYTEGEWLMTIMNRELFAQDPTATKIPIGTRATAIGSSMHGTDGTISPSRLHRGGVVDDDHEPGTLRAGSHCDEDSDRYEGNSYRLLDARDGWNYLAIPITPRGSG